MDTRWKKSKAVTGFISWFFGISILIANMLALMMEISCYEDFGQQADTVFMENYQNMEEFRGYISDYLDIFLTMSIADENLQEEEEHRWVYEYEDMPGIISDGYGYYEDGGYGWEGYGYNWRMNRAEAEEYHNDLKGERNILYRIEREGKVLFTNEENLGKKENSAFILPEGYNFLLYFDGEKAEIWRDGTKIDIYGDGYYREDNEWYIPGYINFPAGEMVKDSRVWIAAAKVPASYIKANYSGYDNRYDNSFYYMQNSLKIKKMAYEEWIYTSLFGLLLLLMGFAFRRERKEAEISIAEFTGKIWYEIKLIPLLAVFALFLFVILRFINNLWWMDWNYIYELMDAYAYYRGILPRGFAYLILFLCIVIIWMFINDSRRHRSVWKKSLTGMVVRTFRTASLKLPVGKRMVKRNIVICIFIWMMCIICFLFVIMVEDGIFTDHMFFVSYILIQAVILCVPLLFVRGTKKTAEDMDQLVEQIQAIHDGELWEEREMSEGSGLSEAMDNLKDIRNGMDRAVKEQIRSERMKVELVANVSHDIKTPLTSIISYVELLKQEENLPGHIKEYVEILDHKSQRLKSMIQDVFEVSKAVSGNLPVIMEELDLAKLLKQTIADMEEQIENSVVTVRPEIPESPVMINADGERMYRVFQNLMQNALKYSLEGSRIYITLQSKEETAIACVKNISKEELNSDMDFTERFVRGDKSRSDEGSGLGLSIAQSFTEACGGEFKVEAIADLFVVTVSFHESSFHET